MTGGVIATWKKPAKGKKKRALTEANKEKTEPTWGVGKDTFEKGGGRPKKKRSLGLLETRPQTWRPKKSRAKPGGWRKKNQDELMRGGKRGRLAQSGAPVPSQRNLAGKKSPGGGEGEDPRGCWSGGGEGGGGKGKKRAKCVLGEENVLVRNGASGRNDRTLDRDPRGLRPCMGPEGGAGAPAGKNRLKLGKKRPKKETTHV